MRDMTLGNRSMPKERTTLYTLFPVMIITTEAKEKDIIMSGGFRALALNNRQGNLPEEIQL